MRPTLVPLIAILAAQVTSAFPNAPLSSNSTTSSLLNQGNIWYSRAHLYGNVGVFTATIKGQAWVATTIGKDPKNNRVGDNCTLVLKEVYPVQDGNAIVGRFHLVERDFDFGAVIAPVFGG